MRYQQLFNQAYVLCVKCNSQVIAHDLAYMTELELLGVINFLTQMHGV